MVKRELLDTVKVRKLAYYGHTMRKQGSCLEKEIMQGTMPGARRRGRPRTARMDNINTWTGLPVEESIRMTEDRDKMEKVCPWCGQPSHRGRIFPDCLHGSLPVSFLLSYSVFDFILPYFCFWAVR